MLWVLKHGLFSSPRKLSLWPKKCTFLLTPWPAVTDTQTLWRLNGQKRGRIGCSGELWKSWSYYPPPEKCVCRPQELLTFCCSVLWFMGATVLPCECYFSVNTGLATGKCGALCVSGQEVSLILPCRCRNSLKLKIPNLNTYPYNYSVYVYLLNTWFDFPSFCCSWQTWPDLAAKWM